MTELIAKAIVKNQYWVITDGDKKVGNVIADQNGFDVKLHGTDLHFTSTEDIRKKTKIIFESVRNTKSKQNYPYPEYPTTNKVYNSVMDIKRKLHLFTKTTKSKCFYVVCCKSKRYRTTNSLPKVYLYSTIFLCRTF
jgi:hypothetical protein